MAQAPKKWIFYYDRVIELIKEDNLRSPTEIAKQIAKEKGFKYEDTFRIYVSRQRLNLGLPPSQHGIINPQFANSSYRKQLRQPDISQSLEETSDQAIWNYTGEQSITTLEQALEFANVDPDKWEPERWIFNSWDVSMKDINGESSKRTNYQVKVWFRPKRNLDIEEPKFRNIKIPFRKANQMWVAIGCVHRPFHDKSLWDKFLVFLEHNKKDITGILINGDFGDLRSLSSHEEWIPDNIDLAYEYSDMLQGIDDIEHRLKKDVDKIFHYGNHEDRFFRDKKSIRKYGSSLPSPHEAMQLDTRGWEIITDWKNGYTTLGANLDIFHGVKIGMNAAKDQLKALPNRNHIFNHTHRFATYSEHGYTAYNIGCMIDFDHEVFKYTDRGVRESWAHGFAVVYIDNKNNTHVYPIRVDSDKSFFFEGVIY